MFDLDDTMAALTEPQREVLLVLLNAEVSISSAQLHECCPSLAGTSVVTVMRVLHEQDLAGPHHAWPTVTWSVRPWLRNIYASRGNREAV